MNDEMGVKFGENQLAVAAERVRTGIAAASRGLVERDVLVQLIALAAVAEEHLLVIGEPGTAKSEAVRRVARALGGRYFEYLLGRFTEPSELFGPIDLLKLQQGKLETVTTGMLPEAEIAFLDEVFLGSTAILNALLGVLNERCFRRGSSVLSIPLKICVGASNALPQDPALAAFADRFLVRAFVRAVPDSELEFLLSATQGGSPVAAHASLADLALLANARRSVDLLPLRSLLANAVRSLRRAGIALTDRRIVRAQSLVSAATVLAGRTVASANDLWPLVYAVPTEAEQDSAREALRELLAQADSPLSAAALDASAGPRARAARIAELSRALLAERESRAADAGFRLQIEGILREIDASFPASAQPEPIPAVRAELSALLAAAPHSAVSTA